MTALKLIETSPGKYSLLLNAGTTGVDDVIEGLGHEPNGYFWAGVARLLVSTEAPALDGRFSYDPEAGMFCAYGTDRAALEALSKLLAPVTTDADQARKVVELANAKGVELDD
ncbi:Imm51 family immunity protein [Dactylosporangium sp. NPDC049525]|uniref:Imm51 family immunity protein n=1 Tax=Dactylosporangium sp. NPDC049525 TaxID=3154730 RepID=UPI003414DB6D